MRDNSSFSIIGKDGAPEAPGLSFDETVDLPPIDKVAPEGRSNDQTIDSIFKKVDKDEGTEVLEQQHPMAMKIFVRPPRFFPYLFEHDKPKSANPCFYGHAHWPFLGQCGWPWFDSRIAAPAHPQAYVSLVLNSITPLTPTPMQEGQTKGRSNFKQDELFDMDMLLTPEQQDQLFGKTGRKRRAAIKQTLWPQGILPYSLTANTFSEQDKTVIYAAMK